jgi:2-haloacid dehalogenase
MDHIVFDIGNVLIDWNPERPFKRLIPDEQHRALFLTEICNQAWNIEQDHGRSWADAEEALIAVYPEWEELILAYRKHWIETITGPEPGGFELRDELKADGYRLIALSNFSVDTFEEVSGHYPQLLDFEGLTISGRVGLIKPDAEIYLHHAKTFDLDPARTVFIDDSQANVSAAIAQGWQAVRFKTADQTRSELGTLLS